MSEFRNPSRNRGGKGEDEGKKRGTGDSLWLVLPSHERGANSKEGWGLGSL